MINVCKAVAVGVGMLFLASPHAGQAACDTARFNAPPRQDFAVGSNPPAAPCDWPYYSCRATVAVGDFNGDGTADLAVANAGSNTVSILLGTGTGSFGAPSNFTVGTSPHSVAVGDFNGDGTPDLAVANAGSNNVSILLGTGTGSFGAARNFKVWGSPHSVAVGDFNGDGTPDLAVATGNLGFFGGVSILLGTGTGSFRAATYIALGSYPEIWSVAVGDFNGDTKLDLAVAFARANGDGDGDKVLILLGTGTGSFGAPTSFAVGVYPVSVVVADFNGDGIADLAVANGGSENVSILLGTGTGSFGTPTNFAVEMFFLSMAVGDFNGDGTADLAVANGGSNTVSILLGTGTGGFGSPTESAVGRYPKSVAVGDFNGDGIPDLAVANYYSNDVSILLGTETGSFGAPSNFTVGTSPYSVAVGDFNGDDTADLAVANAGSNTVSILLGTGTGSFGAATNFAVGVYPVSVAVGDFNGDNRPDVAVANAGSNKVSILLGTGTGSFGAATDFGVELYEHASVAVGDFNDDGTPDLVVANGGSNKVSILLGTGTGSFGAATDFAAGAGPGSVAVGDFNDDGTADLAVANAGSNTVSILLNTCVPPDVTGPDWAAYGRGLLDDGAQALLRMTQGAAERLVETGAAVAQVTRAPMVEAPEGVGVLAAPAAITPDPVIQGMLNQVTSTTVSAYGGQLSGEQPMALSDGPYTITTRYTDSGMPIQKALQFVEEHLVGLGYSVENHVWSKAGYTNVNVIGERTGTTNPSDIYIIGAQLDSAPSSGAAPGADDDASGSVAVLIAADILSQYQWGCTLRFAFWTGEEQAELGSSVYAARSKTNGENVKGYLNLDGIGYNALPPPTVTLYWTSTVPASQNIADLFVDVVSAYGLDLVPLKYDAVTWTWGKQSDNASFSDQGYPSIWPYEDVSNLGADLNPFIHSDRDRMSALDMGYFTTMVKAAVGTFAHMSGCLIEPVPTETPTLEHPSPTPSETPTATRTVTPIPSATPSSTPTLAPSATPPPSATPVSSATATRSATSTPKPSATSMSDDDDGGCAIIPVRSGGAPWWLLVLVLALWARRGDRAGRAGDWRHARSPTETPAAPSASASWSRR